MTLHELLERAREGTGLVISERDVERTLAALCTSGDLWHVIDYSDVPVMALCRLLEAMRAEGIITWDTARIQFSPQGRTLCEQLSIRPVRQLACPTCRGRGLDLRALGRAGEAFAELAASRPSALQEFDQGYVTEESTMYRVALMWARGDLEGKDVLVLGDDDLVSVAAALTGAPRRVTALDVDPRILGFIEDAARQHDLPIETVEHDLRRPLPPELVGHYDAFACDPTESLHGFLSFVQRGLVGLRGPGGAGYLGLTRREASLAKWREIQKALIAQGSVITDIIHGFHDYPNWPYIRTMTAWEHLPVKQEPDPASCWYRSDLIRIELLEASAREQSLLEGDIFNDAEAATT